MSHIALIGAPGSGKTKLANQIKRHHKDYKIIDGYVPKFEKRTNIALSYLAPLVPNIMVAGERLALEHNARDKTENVISCGTTVETIAYATLYSIAAMEHTSDKRTAAVRINATLDALLLFTEAWYYHHVFYLPLPSNEDTDPIAARLDLSIRDILSDVGIDHIPLTDEDRYTVVAKKLKEDQDEPAKLDQ